MSLAMRNAINSFGDNPSRTIRPRCAAGFTLVETLVVVLICGVLLTLMFVSLTDSKRTVRSGVCLANLRQIGGGLRQYATDNNKVMPDPAVTGISWSRAIQPYVGGSVFACPGDTEIFPATGLSYDWRDTGDPATTMAGRSIEQSTRPSAVLTFESLPGWHLRGKINVSRLDGSTQMIPELECFQDLHTPLRVAKPPAP